MTNHSAKATLLTCLLLGTSMFLAGCGGEASRSTSDAKAADTTDAATAPIAYGRVGKAGGIELTVTAVTTPSAIGPAGVGIKAETGETFVVVSFTLKNVGPAALPMMERPSLSLIDGAGRAYAPDTMASTMSAGLMADASGMVADLNPNVSAKTKAAWKVDKAAFDRGTWRLTVASDPQLTFALK